MGTLIDFILHIDSHLVTIVQTFGNWSYVILFGIIFIETGAIILPFLPGDSLLFAAAAMAASSVYHLNIWIFVVGFLIACVAGDSLNFHISKHLGHAASQNAFLSKYINEKRMHEAEELFDRTGDIIITLARFMPIIRTFIPFVAGGSTMTYKRFLPYNLLGCAAWVALCCGAGYWFGNFPFVKAHFSVIIIAIIVVSLIPIVFTGIRSTIKGKKKSAPEED
ncbi:VTT domain-containing protein [Lacticaseibacillus zhaodongensis]|uniref:VTT domain-containing protein n=1 Tax=Lacticaseibacillus zhaodongensis TaxID=2668065 RepID=UPI0012D33BA6|nr:VTT domain-containing protein [Lacticaseibacillus zhaodongensis]